MTTDQERMQILKMIESGRVTAEEGQSSWGRSTRPLPGSSRRPRKRRRGGFGFE